MQRHPRRSRAHSQYQGIGVELAGVALHARGYLTVNDRLELVNGPSGLRGGLGSCIVRFAYIAVRPL